MTFLYCNLIIHFIFVFDSSIFTVSFIREKIEDLDNIYLQERKYIFSGV